MSEHLSEELIALFTSGWASPAELARVEAHVGSVEGCRSCLDRIGRARVATPDGAVFVPATSQNEAYVTMTEEHWEKLKAKRAEKPRGAS